MLQPTDTGRRPRRQAGRSVKTHFLCVETRVTHVETHF